MVVAQLAFAVTTEGLAVITSRRLGVLGVTTGLFGLAWVAQVAFDVPFLKLSFSAAVVALSAPNGVQPCRLTVGSRVFSEPFGGLAVVLDAATPPQILES